jgi:hypothetical protein
MMAFTNANALFTHHQIPGNLAFTNFDADVDQHHPTIVGPQLAMPMYPYDVVDDRPAGQFIFNKYVWDPPMDEADGSLAFFGPLDAANQHCNNPDMHVSNTGQVDMSDAATTASLETGDSPPFSSKSPNSSQSSASHRALQGSYNSLLEEARRFVHTATPLRTTAVDQPPNPEWTNCSPTQDSFSEPFGVLSPTMTAGTDHPSPTVNKEINYN